MRCRRGVAPGSGTAARAGALHAQTRTPHWLSCSVHSCSLATPPAPLGAVVAGGGGGVALAGGGVPEDVALLDEDVALLAFCARATRAASARHSSSCARRAITSPLLARGFDGLWSANGSGFSP